MTKTRRWISEYIGVILLFSLIVAVFGSILVEGITGLIKEKRARDYCYSINLVDVHKTHRNVYYCAGVRDGNTIVVSIPDSALRKE